MPKQAALLSLRMSSTQLRFVHIDVGHALTLLSGARAARVEELLVKVREAEALANRLIFALDADLHSDAHEAAVEASQSDSQGTGE